MTPGVWVVKPSLWVLQFPHQLNPAQGPIPGGQLFEAPPMSSSIIGVLLFVLSSLSWAAGVMFFRHGSESMTAFSVNVGKNVVGLLLFTLTLPLLGKGFFPSGVGKQDLLLLYLSGIVGIGLGDLLFLRALKLLGAGINSIVGSVYTPLLVFGAILFLGEPLTLTVTLGTLLVVTAILLIATGNLEERPAQLLKGILAGVVGMLSTVTGVLLMKDLLARHSIWWVNWSRLIAGLTFFGIYYLFRSDKAKIKADLTSRKNWKIMVFGGTLGTYFAIVFWTGGLARLPASVAGILGQLTLVAIIVFARIFLGETITLRKMLASTLAITGALLATAQLF